MKSRWSGLAVRRRHGTRVARFSAMLLFVKMGVEDREEEMMTRSEVQRTNKPSGADAKLARRLVLDELFDLSLYQSLRDVATGELRTILEQLIPIESRHLKFWQVIL